ncbi:MAG: hypothetical protein J5927_02115, partial [Oscillospiraceae bacterium]|nr:hypothetical protein [Oscillospiraceae bacterium]
ARGRCRFEEALPLGCMLLTLLLFLLGLLGLLGLSAAAVLILCAACYLLALAELVRNRDGRREALRRFFTPGFFLFAFLFLYFFALDKGRLVWEFDGLSHWGDVVRAMFDTGALSTSSRTHSAFQSYPPAVSLFQYLAQALNRLCGGGFEEWRLYHAYQVFFVSFLFPFLRRLDFRRIYAWLAFAVCFLAPTFLFESVYSALYVDPFLGMVSGAGLAAVLLAEREDRGARLFVLLCAATLTLSKESGLLLGVILIAAFWAAELDRAEGGVAARLKTCRGALLAVVGSVLLPWGLWQMSIRLNHAHVNFSEPVDWGQLLRILTFRDGSYRKEIRDSFVTALLGAPSSASFRGISLSFVLLFALGLTALLYVCKRQIRRQPEKRNRYRAVWWLVLVQLALFLFALLVMYLFKFSEYEARQLASLERYVAVPMLSAWMLTAFLTVDLIGQSRGDRNLAAVLVFTLVLCCTPASALHALTNREEVGYAASLRQPINDLAACFREADPGEEQRLYFIDQGESEYPFYMAKFSFRPHWVSSPLGWSLGEPFFEGDVWTRPATAEQLRQTLLADYDYVILYQVNDSFRENFAALFDREQDIGPMRIYAVDRESGTLRLFARA